ncbi:LOW QUALITY PROTEIN: organic cation/carnitine transporter 7 isoform X3 [Populus alba x Populus x berolinensis]|nr:LOW QUALITY PROTEIN: organic cation/carnitine transporter 7 isoform X3 [Populus alba x Populus x berolinensis]
MSSNQHGNTTTTTDLSARKSPTPQHGFSFFDSISYRWNSLFQNQKNKFHIEEEEERSAFTKMTDGGPRYTVDDAILAMGFGKFQYLVLLYAGMGWVSESMEMMILSFVGPAVKSDWDLTSQQESLITSVVFAGMLVGAYSWGVVSDRCGRRKGFLVTAIITFGAGFLSAFAPNYITLLISRCLVGLGLGGGPVLLAWFLEFVPAPNRGAWMIIMPRLNWRWLLALSALPSFPLLLFYFMTPESPRYFCLKGQKIDALSVLNKIAKQNGKELPPGVLATDNEIEAQGNNLPTEGTEEVALPSATPLNWKDSDMGVLKSLLMLLSPKLIRSTVLLWVVFFGNAFSYYGLVLLTTELNNRSNTCHNTKAQSQGSSDVAYKEVLIASEFSQILQQCFYLHDNPHSVICSAIGSPSVTKCNNSSSLWCSNMHHRNLHHRLYIRSRDLPNISEINRHWSCKFDGKNWRDDLPACGSKSGARMSSDSSTYSFRCCVLLFPFETKGLELTDSISSTKYEKPKAVL